MSKKVLVTGGAGAIGFNLCKMLVENGFEVLIIDDLSSGHQKLVHREAKFFRGSILSDETLREAFTHEPNYVVHLAAFFANQNSVDFPEKDLLTNILGTVKLLTVVKEYGVEKFVNVSSSCVYGNKEIMKETDHEFDLDTPYAISKLSSEYYTKFWETYHQINAVNLRLFNSYGPGEFPGKYRNVIPNFFQKAMNSEPLVITGTGEETRDFNFVEDTVLGIMLAMIKITKPGQTFNIASGKSTRIIDIARMIREITFNKSEIIFGQKRSWDSVDNRLGDIHLARSVLGYDPKKDIYSGLKETFNWLKINYEASTCT